LDLVSELGSSFEEEEKERTQEETWIKEETKDKGNKQVSLETMKEPRN
jgi:hypothetical protein